MKDLTGRERLLLAVALIAIVVFVYLYALAIPLHTRASGVARDERTLATRMAAAAGMYDDTANVTDEIAALRLRAGEMLRTESDVPVAVMRRLDALASEAEVVLTDVRPLEAEPLGDLIRYPTTVKIKSDFPHLVRLLYEIQRPEHRLWVEEVQISAGRSGGDELDTTLRVTAFTPAPESEELDA
jgi:hypothetical protein